MRVTPFQFNRERQQKPTRNVIAKRPRRNAKLQAINTTIA